ncbi:MAG: histidine decarboxylase, partial [Proteobacteria bacterium]|nr:histidine decarboxylase [Pseudomonadota bacterium]
MNDPLPGSDQRILHELLARVKHDSDHMIGYPSTRLVDFSPLYPFLDQFLNNIGDPYLPTSFRINTHDFECEVIAWFKSILRADDKDVWGYVTGGGTEGNMYGVYLARELFPNGIVYYSEDTHYSVTKVLRMVNMRSIMIKSRPDGEIDYDDLAATLGIHRDVPPIIFANIGTTMRGAIDNLDKIKMILKERAITRYYLHADAALSGMILPFVNDPQPFGFDAGIDSIAVSGHKMPGIPMPCGIAMAKREHVNRISRAVEYIGTSDTTVTGSRSGLTPLFFWYLIKTLGENGFRKAIVHCADMAEYAIEKFSDAGIHAWRHRNSITVVFPRKSENVLKKW